MPAPSLRAVARPEATEWRAGTHGARAAHPTLLPLVPHQSITSAMKSIDCHFGADSIWPRRGVSCGCLADIPAVIPLAMCYLGWQESLLPLAAMVEPDTPG